MQLRRKQMTALEELFLEIEKHAILRAHASLVAAARVELETHNTKIAAANKMVKLSKQVLGFVEYLASEFDADEEEMQLERDLKAVLKEWRKTK